MMTLSDDTSDDSGIGNVTEQQLSCYPNFATPLYEAPFVISSQGKE